LLRGEVVEEKAFAQREREREREQQEKKMKKTKKGIKSRELSLRKATNN
jgi:hypothetical protein